MLFEMCSWLLKSYGKTLEGQVKKKKKLAERKFFSYIYLIEFNKL